MTARAIAFQRLRRSRRAAVGALTLAMLVLLAIFADFVAGDAPLVAPHARGRVVFPTMMHARAIAVASTEAREAAFPGELGIWPVVRAGPERASDEALAPPSAAHPLGTDERGRDVVARLVFGARTAIGIGLVAVLLSLVLGGALGGAAGFVSRAWDTRLERFVEIAASFPVIVIVALVRAIETRPSFVSLAVAVAILRSAEVARLVRAEVLRASADEYVLAARALGGSSRRVFWKHMAPNVVGPVLVSATIGVGSVALVEAAVSFLELGPAPSAASWGEMLAEGARHTGDVRLAIYPGLLLFATVGATYLVGDALREAFDARTPPRESKRVVEAL